MQPNFKCPLCEAFFDDVVDLNKHLRLVHPSYYNSTPSQFTPEAYHDGPVVTSQPLHYVPQEPTLVRKDNEVDCCDCCFVCCDGDDQNHGTGWTDRVGESSGHVGSDGHNLAHVAGIADQHHSGGGDTSWNDCGGNSSGGGGWGDSGGGGCDSGGGGGGDSGGGSCD